MRLRTVDIVQLSAGWHLISASPAGRCDLDSTTHQRSGSGSTRSSSGGRPPPFVALRGPHSTIHPLRAMVPSHHTTRSLDGRPKQAPRALVAFSDVAEKVGPPPSHSINRPSRPGSQRPHHQPHTRRSTPVRAAGKTCLLGIHHRLARGGVRRGGHWSTRAVVGRRPPRELETSLLPGLLASARRLIPLVHDPEARRRNGRHPRTRLVTVRSCSNR